MFETLPGFREFYPDACAVRNCIFQQWRKVAHRFGFQEYDAPVLEPLELFTTKSGEEIVEQLFAFEDRGGRKVALRPETTPSLVRLIGAKSATMKRPIKWFNITENFRYERPQKGRLRSFYQFNLDIVGEPSCLADAELIALAIASFQSFGLTREHFYVRLSDRQLWILWLACFNISQENEVAKVLNLLDKWERRPQADIEKDLLPYFKETSRAREFFCETERLRTLHSLAEIRQFFTENPRAKEVQGLEERLQELQRLLQHLADLQCADFVTIDLGIVRGLAYYTGFVFEVFESDLNGRALAGGGRYDCLFKKLTGNDLPAVGFAAGDVTLTEILNKYNLLPPTDQTIDAYVVFEESSQAEALKWVQKWRQSGLAIMYGLSEFKSFSKQLKKAYDQLTKHVILLGETECKNGCAQVKNTQYGTSENIPLTEVATYLKK